MGCKVFFIKYLRPLVFSTANDRFAENAWYFKNKMDNGINRGV